VTTGDGKTRRSGGPNLRFMTDSSQDELEAGAPAIMAAGMMGDRAAVIFAAPDEIAKMIEQRCWRPEPTAPGRVGAEYLINRRAADD
jgi:cytochrome c